MTNCSGKLFPSIHNAQLATIDANILPVDRIRHWAAQIGHQCGDFFAAEAGPLDLSAYSAGDTVTFTWSGRHSVYRQPRVRTEYPM